MFAPENKLVVALKFRGIYGVLGSEAQIDLFLTMRGDHKVVMRCRFCSKHQIVYGGLIASEHKFVNAILNERHRILNVIDLLEVALVLSKQKVRRTLAYEA